jgi:organic radical activating enzyme
MSKIKIAELFYSIQGEGNPSKRGTNDYEWEEFI